VSGAVGFRAVAVGWLGDVGVSGGWGPFAALVGTYGVGEDPARDVAGGLLWFGVGSLASPVGSDRHPRPLLA